MKGKMLHIKSLTTEGWVHENLKESFIKQVMESIDIAVTDEDGNLLEVVLLDVRRADEKKKIF